jgi:hypothetical protein
MTRENKKKARQWHGIESDFTQGGTAHRKKKIK